MRIMASSGPLPEKPFSRLAIEPSAGRSGNWKVSASAGGITLKSASVHR
jgi:hypothetical protein